VEFKGNRRAFYQWAGDAPPPPKTAVIVAVERGEDLGRVHSTGELAEKRKAGTTHGKASPKELPKLVRVAKPEEVDRAVRLRADEHAVRKAAIEFARELKLDLKISDTEWQWDRRKLTCYFTAEDRVDFRELVRRLAAASPRACICGTSACATKPSGSTASAAADGSSARRRGYPTCAR
jgi:cell fate regulator YaaT (PSP1 superfamily)